MLFLDFEFETQFSYLPCALNAQFLREILKLKNCKTGKSIFSSFKHTDDYCQREKSCLAVFGFVVVVPLLFFPFLLIGFELTLFLYHVIHPFGMCMSVCGLTTAHLIFALLLFKCSFFFSPQVLLVFQFTIVLCSHKNGQDFNRCYSLFCSKST